MAVQQKEQRQQRFVPGWPHVRLTLMILSAALLAGSVCLAAGMFVASIYLPEDAWTETVSAIGGAAYLLAIFGSFAACGLSLMATLTVSRSAALPAILLFIASLSFACLTSVLLAGVLIQAGQLPPLLPSRPSAVIATSPMPGLDA